MKIAIVKYNAGNIQSLAFAIERLRYSALVTDDPDKISKADKIIFPGVGEASTAMLHLQERSLDVLIKNLTQPVLGICLGMQLLCEHSEEGDVNGLEIFDTVVKKFNNNVKSPQIGWNTIFQLNSPLFRGVEENSYCYFVNSYYAEICSQTVSSTEYGGKFSSALEKDNFFGVQFHPEKSADVGQRILENFLKL